MSHQEPEGPTDSDHVCGHTITNEEDDVLRAADLGHVTNEPSRLGLSTVVVCQSSDVLARLVQSHLAVSLRSDIDEGGPFGIPGEEVCSTQYAHSPALLE